jgi:organic hydroperoxide reductase OsmC/OhrA
VWQRSPHEAYTDRRYSRRHLLRFDGGMQMPGSSAVSSVPLPYSDPAAVDPEEMFIAALSSCHLLWFLDLTARQGFVVDSYVDDAVGILAANAEKQLAMTQVILRPKVAFSGDRLPSRAEQDALHHQAHERCFIANSVRSEVRCEPVWA